MNEEQQTLIKNAAILAGMIVLDKPAEHTDTDAVYFFFDPYGGKLTQTMTPIKATTYAHSELALRHGSTKFGLSWERFDPLTDPRAMVYTMKKLRLDGYSVSFTVAFDNAYCNIYSPNLAVSVEDTGADMLIAFCKACLNLTTVMKQAQDADYLQPIYARKF